MTKLLARVSTRMLTLTTALGLLAVAPPEHLPSLTAPAAHAEIKPAEFGKMPRISDGDISPNGKRVALYVNEKGQTSVQIFDLDAMTPVGGFSLPEGSKPGGLIWANDDHLLARVWSTEEAFGSAYNTVALYNHDMESGKGGWLIRRQKTRRSGSRLGGSNQVLYEVDYANIIDVLPDDPDHILMSFADERTGVRPVHKVNLDTGAYSTVEGATSNTRGWATDTTGTVRVAVGLPSGATSESDLLIRIKDENGEWQSASDWPGLDADTAFLGFTTKPNEMVIGTRNGRDTVGLYVYDINTRSITRKLFHHPTYDVGGVVRDPQTREVIGAQFTSDEAEVELFDGRSRAMDRMTAAYRDHQVRYYDTTPSGDTLLFRISQPYDPGVVLLLKEGQDQPVVVSSMRPGLDPDDLGLVVPVKYTARDGQSIPAYVTLPPTVNDTASIKDLPFIVYPHGGPYARDNLGFDFMAQFFASRGYGVLQMNFRGSEGYGQTFADAGRKSWKTMRDDVVDGADWLVEKGYADPDRMCVGGWSYGGYSALMSGVEHPEKFACVISIAALSDLEGEVANLRNYRNGKIAQKLITEGFSSREEMQQGSPVRVVQNMTLPTFIAHGTLDVNVDYDQHKKLRRALKSSPAKVTEMTFEGDDHYMSVEENRQEMLQGIAKFLRDVNGRSEFMK